MISFLLSLSLSFLVRVSDIGHGSVSGAPSRKFRINNLIKQTSQEDEK